MASIGPELPPGFKIQQHSDSEAEEKEEQTKASASIGPALPPGFKLSRPDSTDDSSADSSDSDSETESRKRPGPEIPAELLMQAKRAKVQSDSESAEDDGDMIGPLPPSADQQTTSNAAEDFERRAQRMKDKLLNKDVPAPTQRDNWMMELPKTMEKNFPLENRTFSRRGVKTEQDSSWTDAPNSAPKKAKGDDAMPLVIASKRDRQMAEQVEKHNSANRELSLYELHQKKHSKKSKKEKKEKKEKKHKKDKKHKKEKKEKKDKKKEVKAERRPFSRDEDLQVNRFDDAKRKQLIKKSAILNTKFGHGSKQFI